MPRKIFIKELSPSKEMTKQYLRKETLKLTAPKNKYWSPYI